MNYNNVIIEREDHSVTKADKFNDSIALRFQELSKYDKFSFMQEYRNINLFSTPYMTKRASQPYKHYATDKKIQLSVYGKFDKDTLLKTINERRSCRHYQKYNLSLNEVYKILHFSYGITGGAPFTSGEGWWNYRAVPSGGALYPLEVYIYLHQSVLPCGLYHYLPENDSLEVLFEREAMKEISGMVAAGNVNMESLSAVVFISSVFQRSMIKYGERGYRFILQEVGFVEQNMSLICQDLGLSSCMLGGYIDDRINNFLGLIPPMETIQGVLILGKAADTKASA